MYGGLFRGLVAANQDPSGLKRVRLTIPKLFGDTVTNWAHPSAPTLVGSAPSTVTVPALGSVVWIMFENEDPDYPVWLSG